MVDFCPECSSLLRKKNENGKSYLACRCGYEEELIVNHDDIKKEVEKKNNALNENLIVVTEQDKVSVHPIVTTVCPKCGSKQAEAWQEQTRSADEPSTSFFKCTKCKFTWREY